MIILLAGPEGDHDPRETLRANGHRVAEADGPIGDTAQWMCSNCGGVFMLPGWRNCLRARALRAVARAAGLAVLGFE